MKKLLLIKVFFLSLFMAYGQVSKTNTLSGTVTNVPASGAHIDRTFSFSAADFPNCTPSGLTEVEISIRLILGNGTPPTPGAYGVHEDLNVRLVSPAGTAVDLIQDRWGYWIGMVQTNTYSGFTAVDGTMHFDDDHPNSVIPVATNEWTTGNFSPHNPLSTFDGESPIGTWTLRISDGNDQFGAADYFHFVESTLTVTCGVACSEPTIPSVTASTNPICNGGSTTLNISGTLNDATQWHIYTGFCGVTPVGTTAGSTFTVSPTTTTTYYIRGEGGCTTPGTCGAVTVTVNPTEDASFGYSAAAYCVSDADPTPTITGVGGGTFSSTAGLSLNTSTGAIDVSASTPGTYTVTYTTAGACPGSSNVSVTINSLDDPSFSYSAAAYCASDADPTPTITGLPGGTFSSVPGGLSLNTSTGAIDVSASTPGTYTVTYLTAGACPNSSNVSVTINAPENASFSYSAAAYCVSDADPTPTITGVGGGTFSSTAGLSFNSTTGAIDVSASTPGTYTVTYTTSGSCPGSSNVSVTINALDDASFAYGTSSFCVNTSDPIPTITGLAGGTFTSAPAGLSISGSTGLIDVSASTPGTYTVTYTTAGPCPNSSNVSITINALDDASYSYSSTTYCANDADPTPTITGVPGGSFFSGGGLPIDGSTGTIDLSASTPGTYTVTYMTTGTCPNSFDVSVTINALDDPSFSYSAFAHCVSAPDPTPTITGLAGGTFSSTAGLSINASTGTVDVSASTPGTYLITYTTAGTCPNSSSVSLAINALDDPSFSYSATTYCTSDTDPTPTITGFPVGFFTSTAGLSINSGDGTIDVSASTPGTYTVTYNTQGPCPNTSNVSVTISTGTAVTFTALADLCVGEGVQTGLSGGSPAGGVYSGPGVTDDGNGMTYSFDPAAAGVGIHTITYTVSGACTSSASDDVEVTNLDDASFNYSAPSYCVSDTDPTPTITGVAGGTFTSTAGLSIDGSTGAIDLSASTPGTYTVTYTTAGACSNSTGQSVTINSAPTAPTVLSPLTFCPGDDAILSATGSGTGNIVFYDDAMVQISTSAMPPATATFNAGALANGSYTYFATEENGGCESTMTPIDFLVGDTTDPTAVCQDITIYLDGAGLATITNGDIDGGSSDNCGSVTLAASQTSFDCSDVGGSPAGTLIITGAYDGPLTGGTPKGVELYVANDIADLSQYGLGSANNGGGTDGQEFTFPAVSATAGQYIYVASEAVQFTNFFGFAPDYTDGSMGINGDDAIELFHMGSVIDVFGDINTDGTGEPWDYLDGWAYRNSGTGPDGSTFTLANWSFSGINVYDGQTSNATTPTPMPIATFTPASSGSTPVTLTVTDGSGNTAMCTANVTVLDTIAPAITCPGDQTEFVDATCSVTLPDYTGLGTATDNCGTATITQSPAAGTVITADQVVTLTAEDANGNTSTCTFNVTLSDNTPPTAVCLNITVYLDGAGNATITPSDIDFGSTDNCGPVTLSASNTVFTCADIGANNVTLTATDGNANSSTCTAVVTVADTTAPTVVCPGNQTEVASAICDFVLPDYTGLVSVTDNCAASFTITQSPVAGTVITADQVITMTADDGNGNTSTCTFTVTLDVSGCAGTECSNAIVVDPLDPCGDTEILAGSTVGGTPNTESFFCGTSLGSGGANWYTFTGDGADWTASTVSGATNYDTKIWVYEGACGSLSCVGGNDDFTGVQSQLTFTTTLGSTYYVVVGGFSANEGNYELTLSNVETLAPVITCPGDQTEAVSPSCDFTLPDYTGLVSATDNCGIPTVTQSPVAGTVITADQVITMTATDAAGNTSTCTFNVILTGATPPVAVCQNITVYLDGSGNASIVAADIDGGSTATCGTPTLSASTTAFTCADLGSNNVTLTVTDGLGNTDDCIAVVTVEDTLVPTPDAASLPDVTAECEVTTLTAPTATDNCTAAVTVTNDATLPISTQGTTVVTWTFDDGNGNTSTQTQNVVITDLSSPLPTAAPLPDVVGECSVDVMPSAPIAVDACTGAITGVETTGTTFPITTQGTTVLVWEFDDGNGNITTQTQNIIVNDVTAPTPDVATLPDLTGDCSIDTPVAPTATDNCDGAIIGTTTTTFPITAIGTTTITWEFVDANGNVSTQTQNATNTGIDASVTVEADGVTITANTGGATYAWLNCDFNTVIAGETGQSFTPSANGNYAAIVTVGNCTDTSACESITSVGIDALAIDQLSVYPNPSESGFFTVSFDGNIEAIDVVDMLGRVIELPTDITTGLVDGSELAYGRYMVRVTTETGVLTTEIVIAR